MEYLTFGEVGRIVDRFCALRRDASLRCSASRVHGTQSVPESIPMLCMGMMDFNIPKQSKDYDPQGEYVQYWLQELARVPAKFVHQPWLLDRAAQQRCGVTIGVGYPAPIVDLAKSVQVNEAIYQAAIDQFDRETQN